MKMARRLIVAIVALGASISLGAQTPRTSAAPVQSAPAPAVAFPARPDARLAYWLEPVFAHVPGELDAAADAIAPLSTAQLQDSLREFVSQFRSYREEGASAA